MSKLTKYQIKALTILKDTSWVNQMNATFFAQQMWPDSNMHKTVSNQGHGATRGKAAWLCAGSYLAKLHKKDLVCVDYSSRIGYYIYVKGLRLLREINLHIKQIIHIFIL